MKTMFSTLKVIAAIAAVTGVISQSAQAQNVRVSITSNAPTDGVVLTPVWVGFHDGSFDSYNGGLSSQEGLERLAEDGNTDVISDDFLAGRTYVQGGASGVFDTAQTTGRVDGTIAAADGTPPPIQPGETTFADFSLNSGDNTYFSYASMVLPSNDYYVANGNPLAFDISSVIEGGGPITFNIGAAGTINDAGTEVNDFTTAAPGGPNLPGLFPGRGLPNGQGGPNTGADENGVNQNVANAFGDFLNASGVDLAGLDFNDTNLYPNGIATITISNISSVPEPGSLSVLAAVAGCGFLRRRRA